MTTLDMDLQPGERVIFESHRRLEWYKVAGLALINLLLLVWIVFGVLLVVDSFSTAITETLGVSPFFAVFLTLLRDLSCGLIFPIIFLVIGLSDLITGVNGRARVRLTDRRILIEMIPNLWNRVIVPLDEIEDLFVQRFGLYIRRKNRKRSLVIPDLPEKKEFVQAYTQHLKNRELAQTERESWEKIQCRVCGEYTLVGEKNCQNCGAALIYPQSR
jgi:hypothetical protein